MRDDTPAEGSRKSGRFRLSFGNIGLVLRYLLLGGLSSLAAAFTATVIIIVMVAPIAVLAALLMWPLALWIIYHGMLYGTLMSLPLTFLVFPTAAVVVKKELARHFLMPVLGLIGGGLIVQFWISFDTLPTPPTVAEILFIGAIVGAASGMAYASMLRELEK